MQLHAIIPAGGAGTRLWPLSTAENPKFLLPLGAGHYSLLQNTVRRLAPHCASLTIVTGQAHADAVQKQLDQLRTQFSAAPELSAPLPPTQVLVEPSGRDSMAAIGLATAVISLRYPQAIVASFAADHEITNETAFGAHLRAACEGAQAGYLTTLGIAPTFAATGYGYIQAGEVLPLVTGDAEQARTGGQPLSEVYRVVAFHEKPDQARASEYLQTGSYWWNAGMFFASAPFLLASLEQYQPRFAQVLQRIAQGWQSPQRAEILTQNWPQLDKMPIDTALAEPLARAGKVAVVPTSADLGWSDVGDYQALKDLAGSDLTNLSPQVQVDTIDAAGALVSAPGLQGVSIVGIPGAVVVLNEGKLLVTTLPHAQRVKEAAAGAANWNSGADLSGATS